MGGRRAGTRLQSGSGGTLAVNIYDISMPISLAIPVYKDKAEKRPVFEVTSDHTPGQTATVRETRVHMDVHTGTHIDAPLHMVPGGATIDALPLNQMVRSCRVVDLTQVKGKITRVDVEAISPREGEFLLFKTANSFEEGVFNPEFVFVAADAAEYLAEKKVAGVGIDALGVERGQTGHPTHEALFHAGATIIEGLRLAHVQPGEYTMIAAPLNLVGLDAAPARILLIDKLL